MANPRLAQDLDELHRDLDLVVFALERRPEDLETARKERARARRELELLRDRLGELIRSL